MSAAFTIRLQSKNRNLHQWMGRFVLLGSSTLFMGMHGLDAGVIGWPILSYLLLIIDIFQNKNYRKPWLISVGLFTQIFAWIFTDQWLLVVILSVLDLLHNLVMQEHVLRIDATGVTASFPWKRNFPWSSIEHIILKDGLLTLEHCNGRVLQQPILQDPALIEADFNEFCQKQCKP